MPTANLVLTSAADFSRKTARHQELGFFHPVVLAWTVVARLMERVRQRRIIADLDGRLLDDIGITRAEVADECGKPFWR